MRAWYFTPVSRALAAYCFTHPRTQPSAWIALGVFFVSCVVTLIARTIAVFELKEYVDEGVRVALARRGLKP